MAVKIRLARHGRKNKPFYHIVAADSKSPRDGRFIEKLGTFDPNQNPVVTVLNFDRALYWLNVGAQPTDTVNTILSNEGVLMMKHLQGGVKKGAFDEAAAEAKFQAWMQAKRDKATATVTAKSTAAVNEAKARAEAEVKANIARAAKIAAKNAPAPVAVVEAEEAPAAESAE